MGRTRDRHGDREHSWFYAHAHAVGQALAEFALVLPFLILILMGVLDLGRAFHTHVALGNAARVGAIYAQQVYDPALQGDCPTPTPTSSATPAPTPPCHAIQVQDVINKVLAEPPGGISTSALTVTVCVPSACYPYQLGVTTTTYPVSLTYGEPISVTVTSPFTPITPFVGSMARKGFQVGGRVWGSTFPVAAPLSAAVLPAEQTAAAPSPTPCTAIVPGAPATLTVTKLSSPTRDQVAWTVGVPNTATQWQITQTDSSGTSTILPLVPATTLTLTTSPPNVNGNKAATYTVAGVYACGVGPAFSPAVSNGR